ncbi:MAG: hypothetical protein HQM09_04785 [Candidatus Riflebacteria bacterium]|nr:hypothetical protein [Candidatus Riflebacteria bacterium]
MNQDFKDLLSTFNEHHVDFMIVGAHALAAHGHVRATKDMDIWVRPDAENAGRVFQALATFGAPLQGLDEKDLATPGVVYQIGVAPVRIDILTEVDGLTFDEAWKERFPAKFAGVSTAVLSRRHLEINKRASGRLQDLADLEALEKLVKPRMSAGSD